MSVRSNSKKKCPLYKEKKGFSRRGGFGTIREVVLHSKNNEKVTPAVMKIFSSRKARRDYTREVSILRKLKHRCSDCVELLDNCFKTENYNYIIFMEYLSKNNGWYDLFDILKTRDNLLNVSKVARNIGNALNEIHELNIVHRDIKLENVMFDGTD